MKRLTALLLSALYLLFALCACTGNKEEPVPLTADSAMIYFSVCSFVTTVTDEAYLTELTDMYNSLNLKKSRGQETDGLSIISIHFYRGGTEVAAFSVDGNGLVTKDNLPDIYTPRDNPPDYNRIKAIYENSRTY